MTIPDSVTFEQLSDAYRKAIAAKTILEAIVGLESAAFDTCSYANLSTDPTFREIRYFMDIAKAIAADAKAKKPRRTR